MLVLPYTTGRDCDRQSGGRCGEGGVGSIELSTVINDSAVSQSESRQTVLYTGANISVAGVPRRSHAAWASPIDGPKALSLSFGGRGDAGIPAWEWQGRRPSM